MIYLDNSATTKIDPEVVESMLPFLDVEYGNPSSKYYALAETAKKSIEDSRNKVAMLINSRSDEIIFTSGASESNNFIIKGISDYLFHEKKAGNHIITTKTEHKSVMETCKWLEKRGYKITYLDVNKFGQVNYDDLEASLTNETILVSIIWGNNEIGTLNDISSLSTLCKDRNILFHSDATQVLGKINIDVQSIPVDFLSFSAHKIHGPKGIGGCFIRKTKIGTKQKITPLIHGGSQEFEYRAGTYPVHNIVGFGKAAEIAKRDMGKNQLTISDIEKVLIQQIKTINTSIIINGHSSHKIPGLVSVTIPGINNELLIRKLRDSVAISTGSACSLNEPSYVLKSIGFTETDICATVRISISKYNTLGDIQSFINLIKSFV
ncbi:MAG TPA: cysteine desulfurase family protein [Clostridia bacterium]